MKVKFSDKFYNVSMRGRVKDLPASLAKELIKLGEALPVEAEPIEVKKTRKPKA